MIRIAGIQRSGNAVGEFILLQNQGAMRVRLSGHLVASDRLTRTGEGSSHLFLDDVWIGPGQFVMLHSHEGHGRWSTSKDGTQVYMAFADRENPLWCAEEPVHVMAIQHTYSRQREALRV